MMLEFYCRWCSYSTVEEHVLGKYFKWAWAEQNTDEKDCQIKYFFVHKLRVIFVKMNEYNMMTLTKFSLHKSVNACQLILLWTIHPYRHKYFI